jgi:poly-gamma-glutamate synthesis protein (capsule biosynthesis protein)
MLSLGKLLAKRNSPHFDLLRVAHQQHQADLIVGGDVMLGRTVGEQIQAGADPFAGVRGYLDGVSWRFVNLECVISSQGAATAGKQYCFRAPAQAAGVLSSAGINAVGLANNHANDFGTEALIDSIANLRANKVGVVGAADSAELAYAPHFFVTRDGQKGALIALTDVEDGRNGATVALASDRDRVARAIAETRSAAGFILCLMHWGDENTARVTERQRELARWLIDHGVDVVAGCHPHCLQPVDFYHGRPVVYSLGNLVFDGAPGLESWNRSALLAVDISPGRAREGSIRLIPLRLDARGFPQPADEGQAEGKIRATAGAAFSLSRVQRDSKK